MMSTTMNRETTTGSMATQARHQKERPTHDVFDVIERDGRKPFWNKIGSVYDDAHGRQTMTLDLDGDAAGRVLQLVAIDRGVRPVRAGGDPARFPTHELFEDNGRSRAVVGVAFRNKDGSLSLVIDEGEREGPKTRLQMREHRTERQRRRV